MLGVSQRISLNRCALRLSLLLPRTEVERISTGVKQVVMNCSESNNYPVGCQAVREDEPTSCCERLLSIPAGQRASC